MVCVELDSCIEVRISIHVYVEVMPNRNARNYASARLRPIMQISDTKQRTT